MTNVNQKRIAFAFSRRGTVAKHEDEGDALSGFPSLVINCGLANALLYADEKEKQSRRIAEAVVEYLLSCRYVAEKTGLQNGGVREFVERLCCISDIHLSMYCTEEALEFLAVLKRVAR